MVRSARCTRAATLATALAVAVAAVPATAAHAAAGRVLHVSPQGSDPSSACATGAGSPQNPWRTLRAAFPCLRPGDTLVVAGGTYTERVEFNQGTRPWEIHGGTATAPITVTAVVGERPLVRGTIRLEGADHWAITDLAITNDGREYGDGDALLKMRGGRDWKVTSVEVADVAAYAAVRIERGAYENTTTLDPTRWRLTDSCVRTTRAKHPPYQDHNIYVASGAASSRGYIERNVVFDAPNGTNIKLGDGTAPANDVAITHNTLIGASQNVLLFGGTSRTVLRSNILGPATGKDWYPNIRGFSLTGQGNAAAHNVGYGARSVVLVGADNGTSRTGIYERGNLAQRDPRFVRPGRCDGFYPTDGAASGAGARATGGASVAGRTPLMGDWDGDGVAGPGWYDGLTGRFSLRDQLDGYGNGDRQFSFGSDGSTPLVGDWNGDGIDTVGVVVGNRFLLSDDPTKGVAEYDLRFGRAGWRPLAGDFDGDGDDEIGMLDGNVFYLRADLDLDARTGPVTSFGFGRSGWRPLVGDWDGDGVDTVGTVAGSRAFLTDQRVPRRGDPVTEVTYGRAWFLMTSADLDGRGGRTGSTRAGLVAVDGATWYASPTAGTGVASLVFRYAH